MLTGVLTIYKNLLTFRLFTLDRIGLIKTVSVNFILLFCLNKYELCYLNLAVHQTNRKNMAIGPLPHELWTFAFEFKGIVNPKNSLK